MAENTDLMDIYKKHTASLDKYTYFLLTAAGAGIGFAFQKTEGAHFSWWLLPVAGATLCWGLSFYFGCRTIEEMQTSTRLNYQMLLIQQNKHPGLSVPTAQMKHLALKKIDETFDESTLKAQNYAARQFFMLITGAVLLVAWRITEMVHLYCCASGS